MYPYFAVFAAWFGAATDEKRASSLLQLAQGTKVLSDLVSLEDRAFLFFVFASFLANETAGKGWYVDEDTAGCAVKRMRRWIEREDQNKAAQKIGRDKVSKHLADIEELLVDLNTHNADDGNADSDDDL